MKKSTAPRLLVAAGMEENDVRYATGLVATDPFALAVDRGRLHLVVSALEAGRAKATCPQAAVHTSADLFGDAEPRRRTMADQILALLERLESDAVKVGPYFPLALARALEASGIEVRLTHAPAFPERQVKTDRELECIARSQRTAVAAVRAAVGKIASATVDRAGVLRDEGKPLTSERVKALIERVLLERGCTAEGTIVACGEQGARPHDEGTGPLRAGEPIVIDVFPRDKRTGYWGDITRTVVRGRASNEVRRMFRTVRAAQELALSMVRPGCASRAVQRAVEQFFRDAGYETRLSPPGEESGFIHSVGHGVGLDVHESPGLRNEPGRLVAGNVVTVEPGLYLPGIGGVRIEDTVAVTGDGHKMLASYPKKLEHGRP
jgi:Xaa-Pro aminopeptidase